MISIVIAESILAYFVYLDMRHHFLMGYEVMVIVGQPSLDRDMVTKLCLASLGFGVHLRFFSITLKVICWGSQELRVHVRCQRLTVGKRMTYKQGWVQPGKRAAAVQSAKSFFLSYPFGAYGWLLTEGCQFMPLYFLGEGRKRLDRTWDKSSFL